MLTKIKVIASTTAFALTMLLGAQSALASTFNPNSVTCSTSNFVTSTDCGGPFSGNDNDSGSLSDDLDNIFSTSGWTLLEKVNDDRGTSGFLTVTVLTEDDDGNGLTGGWEWTSEDGWGSMTKVMAVLKGGPSFSAYLIDLSETSGTWDTTGIVNGNGGASPGLSHLTLYSAPDVVPLPAAGWLLLIGIGGLGVASRRRQKTQTS